MDLNSLQCCVRVVQSKLAEMLHPPEETRLCIRWDEIKPNDDSFDIQDFVDVVRRKMSNWEIESDGESMIFTPNDPLSLKFALPGRIDICDTCHRAQTTRIYEFTAWAATHHGYPGWRIPCTSLDCSGSVFISDILSPTLQFVVKKKGNRRVDDAIFEIKEAWLHRNP